ncbi:glycosyltransferase [Actinocrinis puniceicyclus]|uniref:Glycosyltransferase n=1 Tax=Actinocrinis puniceicyclus TaxID=977794 RepID=A0A8J7WNU0_9ACTN|nr:glycosyltransferase [Actinocrinis puniceicyclus]MBS2964713.1 glycosyltransferase [Actinocrinis puniceicyclus]
MAEPRRVCVVGPGTRFLSGITYYTYSLIEALTAAGHQCSAVLIRDLVPVRLYPGRARVGGALTELRLPPQVPRFDGVDWYWGRSLVRAVAFLRRQRPQVLVLQWWTGAVLHTYLVLAVVARLCGARVVVEFHEAQDVGEARLPFVSRYMDLLGRALLRLSAAQLVHSRFDHDQVKGRYGVDESAVVIPHAGYDYLPSRPPLRDAPQGVVNLLYFGVIRPFKGVEDLIAAVDLLGPDRSGFWLTLVGETWEGWDLPSRLIADSPHRDRITFVNRYVTDDEAAGYFAGADVVVLPYHRSSSSGPLQIAMAAGLALVVTKVGGLVEATAGYPGAVLADPRDPASLAQGILQAAGLVGRRFEGVTTWADTARGYTELFDTVLSDAGPSDTGPSNAVPSNAVPSDAVPSDAMSR